MSRPRLVHQLLALAACAAALFLAALTPGAVGLVRGVTAGDLERSLADEAAACAHPAPSDAWLRAELSRDRATRDHAATPLGEAWSESLPEQEEDREHSEDQPADRAARACVGLLLGPWRCIPKAPTAVVRNAALRRSAPRGPPAEMS